MIIMSLSMYNREREREILQHLYNEPFIVGVSEK